MGQAVGSRWSPWPRSQSCPQRVAERVLGGGAYLLTTRAAWLGGLRDRRLGATGLWALSSCLHAILSVAYL